MCKKATPKLSDKQLSDKQTLDKQRELKKVIDNFNKHAKHNSGNIYIRPSSEELARTKFLRAMIKNHCKTCVWAVKSTSLIYCPYSKCFYGYDKPEQEKKEK